MKKWIKKITGIEDLEKAAEAAKQALNVEQEKIKQIRQEIEEARKESETAAMSEKDRATSRGEPWIKVLDTKVNQDNVRNGFFELDWNDHFVQELIASGYGTDADPQEEIVDRWFRDIVYNMFAEEELDTSRSSGYINVVPISKGKSEVS